MSRFIDFDHFVSEYEIDVPSLSAIEFRIILDAFAILDDPRSAISALKG